MRMLQTLFHMMRADFYQRVRSYRFLAMLLFTIFLTYLFVPALDSIQIAGLQLGGYRGVYNSAWIGSMVTLLMGEFFNIFAFFLIKGNVELDRRTGTGQILAATSMGKVAYMAGKWLSNIAVLAAMTGMIVAGAGVLQLIRGEDASIHLWTLGAPFLLVLMPGLAVIAAVAVLFDSSSVLRGGLGNILFFLVMIPALYLLLDLPGTALVYSSIYQACAAQFAGCTPYRQIDLGLPPLANLPAFRYEGIPWTAELLFGRLALLFVGAIIVLIAAARFHRFDPAKSEKSWLGNLLARPKPAAPKLTEASIKAPDLANGAEVLAASMPSIPLAPLPPSARLGARQLRSYWQVFIAEVRLTLKGVHWAWYGGAVVLIAAGLLIPDLSTEDLHFSSLELAQLIILPLAWVWPLTLWSSLGAREVRNRAEQIVLSAPYPLHRQLPMTWLVGILIALALSSGICMQLALAGRWASLLALGIGAVFVPTLALAMGCWSNGSKLFEGAYLFTWYLASVHLVPYLDFMGRIPTAIKSGMPWFYGGLTLVLLITAAAGRQRQIKI
jgi:hypothetical protein